MIDVTQDIHSLTTFKRNSSGLMKHMRKTGRPLVLTINGKPEAVLLDPTTYQEVADHLDAVASIRRGLAQARKGEANTLARVSRVSPTIPNAARWRVRAFHLTKPYGNCCLELVTGERTGFSSQ